MKRILVPTELTYLSSCALNLGIQVAKLANAKVDVVSVVESNYNEFMEDHEKYSHDPTSSIQNIRITEEARAKMHSQAEEISKMIPDQKILPKILYGNKTQILKKEISDQHIDLVIIGGDLYNPDDKKSNEILYQSDAPILILKCMINGLEKFRDIILLMDSTQDSDALIEQLKILQGLLKAKIHILYVNTPKNFLSAKKCNESLETYASRHEFENFKTVSIAETTEIDGLMKYCDTIKNAFVAIGVHKRKFMERLITNQSKAEKIIANSVHPIWTYKG